MKIHIPEFKTMPEKLSFIRDRKDVMKAMKKSAIKHADAISCFFVENDSENKVIVSKALTTTRQISEISKIYIEPVINTTRLMDSHDDVHIDGLWNRSVNSGRARILNREHRGHDFDYVISDDITPKVITLNWSDLGESFIGQTQALIYPTNVLKDRNEYMFNQYIKGYVKNHSVEMYYVQLFLAMNSNDRRDKTERDVWDMYYQNIINKEVADELGYFWAVTEAKETGGAAVPRGSNYATPTHIIEDSSDKSTYYVDPPNEALDIDKLIKAFKN